MASSRTRLNKSKALRSKEATSAEDIATVPALPWRQRPACAQAKEPGPLRVGIMAGDMLRWGFGYLVYFLAFFSLNLAIFNLLPILPFDGGHFVLFLGELITGRKINKRIQTIMMQIGFIILVALMIFILFVDIFNIFS